MKALVKMGGDLSIEERNVSALNSTRRYLPEAPVH